MADVNINISRAVVSRREGSIPVAPPTGNPTNPYPPSQMFVQSVRGDFVDNTDPYNPIVNGGGGGIGIKLNGKVIGGVKRLIEINDILDIPLHWEYNVSYLEVDGIIDNESIINIG